jgi:hypothetical protein
MNRQELNAWVVFFCNWFIYFWLTTNFICVICFD